MKKRKIIKKDGRYLIYYAFKQGTKAQSGSDQLSLRGTKSRGNPMRLLRPFTPRNDHMGQLCDL